MPQDRDAGAAAGENIAEYTVSEISFAIKRTVEDAFGHVRLRGEISGYRGPHSSGHCYFALKDERARIEAVIWKGVFLRLRHKPEEGLEVVATGRVSSYPGSSKYQIIIEALEPAGAGALLAQLEKLKAKLAAEGLFAEERKQALPFLPGVIGIVTSPTGAVIRDMLHGFDERYPASVVVWPVRVQGESSGSEVAAAVRGFNAVGPGAAVPRPDVLIVARGGGSLEDLWGFNDEAVARAVAESAIPVVSAVGHETDWTLIDLVADARAPTPTKAAEWAVPVRSELLARIDDLVRRHATALRRGLDEKGALLRGAARGLPRLADLLALPRQRLDSAAGRLTQGLLSNTQSHRTRHERLAGRLQPHVLRQRAAWGRERLTVLQARAAQALRQGVEARRGRYDGVAGLLRSLSYQGILERGFALVRDASGSMVRRADAVAAGDALEIEFTDGRVPVTAGDGGAKPRPKVRTRRPDDGSQGTLF